jgi:hypothetical protein
LLYLSRACVIVRAASRVITTDDMIAGGRMVQVRGARRIARRGFCVALVAVALHPAVAGAQFAVFDATGYAENVAQYARMLQQLRAAQSQIANQVTALRKLANPRFRDVGSAWGAVNGAMGSSAGILYRHPNASGSLQSAFPGEVANHRYVPERADQVARTLATAAAVLQAAQAQGSTFDAGRQQLDAMRQQVSSIRGHEQALELQNTVGVFHANEAMLTRQAIEGQANLQAVYYAQQVNAQAQAEADARQVYVSMASRGSERRALVSFRPAV